MKWNQRHSQYHLWEACLVDYGCIPYLNILSYVSKERASSRVQITADDSPLKPSFEIAIECVLEAERKTDRYRLTNAQTYANAVRSGQGKQSLGWWAIRKSLPANQEDWDDILFRDLSNRDFHQTTEWDKTFQTDKKIIFVIFIVWITPLLCVSTIALHLYSKAAVLN